MPNSEYQRGLEAAAQVCEQAPSYGYMNAVNQEKLAAAIRALSTQPQGSSETTISGSRSPARTELDHRKDSTEGPQPAIWIREAATDFVAKMWAAIDMQDAFFRTKDAYIEALVRTFSRHFAEPATPPTPQPATCPSCGSDEKNGPEYVDYSCDDVWHGARGREDAGSPAERQQTSNLHNDGSSPSAPSKILVAALATPNPRAGREMSHINFRELSGYFRAELRAACPSVTSNDAEWIIAYFVTELESLAGEQRTPACTGCGKRAIRTLVYDCECGHVEQRTPPQETK